MLRCTRELNEGRVSFRGGRGCSQCCVSSTGGTEGGCPRGARRRRGGRRGGASFRRREAWDSGKTGFVVGRRSSWRKELGDGSLWGVNFSKRRSSATMASTACVGLPLAQMERRGAGAA